MFTDIILNVAAMRHACNVKFDIIEVLYASILWPYADVIAFVFDAEVLEFLNDWLFQWGAILVEQVEVLRGYCR